MNTKRLSVPAIALAALLPVLAVAAPSAAAERPSKVAATATASPQIGAGKARRYCIDTTNPACGSVGTWNSGSVTMVCWKDAPRAATGAYSSKRYFYLSQGTLRGWVHSSWVTRQTTVPNCSAHKGVSRATWAAARVGEINASSTVATYLGWQSDPRWSGGCAGFGNASFRYGTGLAPRYLGNAWAKYLSYSGAGLGRAWTGTMPPVGSSIFWSDNTYGHEAVYIGNGVVATTWGNLGDTYANRRSTIANIGLGTPDGYVEPNTY